MRLLLVLSIFLGAQVPKINGLWDHDNICLITYFEIPRGHYRMCGGRETSLVYYYNIFLNKCIQGITYPCFRKPTKNNFQTMEECEKVMYPKCAKMSARATKKFEQYNANKVYNKLPKLLLTSSFRLFMKQSCTYSAMAIGGPSNPCVINGTFYYHAGEKKCMKAGFHCGSEAYGNEFKTIEECEAISSLICKEELPKLGRTNLKPRSHVYFEQNRPKQHLHGGFGGHLHTPQDIREYEKIHVKCPRGTIPYGTGCKLIDSGFNGHPEVLEDHQQGHRGSLVGYVPKNPNRLFHRNPYRPPRDPHDDEYPDSPGLCSYREARLGLCVLNYPKDVDQYQGIRIPISS